MSKTIKTEGIKYTGSKLKIIPYILETIKELPIKTVLDGFSGTTRVSQALAQSGYDVTSNDISEWSHVFGNTFLLAKKDKAYYQKYIDHLNELEGYEGWFTKNYGGHDNNERKNPYQYKNTLKLDAIRNEIDRLNLDEIDKSVLITSLIFALDKVDSTIGHYAAYLSNWSPRSYNDLHLKVPNFVPTSGNHTVLKGDIFDSIKDRYFDLAYYDPPYGSNNEKMPPSRVRYASYYHIYTSVVLNDEPDIFGKANRREDSRDTTSSSVFEEYKKNEEGHFIATEAIRKLIQETNAKFILFSYSNGGRATEQELKNIFNESGELLKIVKIDYKKNVMSTMTWTNEWLNGDEKNVEFLFLIKKK